MYTYIPFDKSVFVLSKKLDVHKSEMEELSAGIEIETILNLIKITSRYTNYFKFRDNFYHQVRGLAMGGPLSPLLANIYVEYIENLAIDTYFLKPKFWGRYMDDVLVIWNYGESQIEGFLEHLNNLGGELVFTIENETEKKLPFLDIWIHRKNNKLVFSIYRKPTNNNRYLSFTSNHPIQVKRGVVISLVDRVLNLASPEYISSELIFIKDILVGNGYPENMISQIIEKRKKKLLEPVKLEENESNQKPNYITLPYIPRLSQKLRKELKNHNIKTAFKSGQNISSWLNNGKDKVPRNIQQGVYKIPCSCGKFYVGRTQQNLKNRLQQHKYAIDCSLRQNKKPDTFESAIAGHVYNFPHHSILFDQTKIIDKSVGLLQSFREIIEIKKIIYGGISINRDEGEFKINSIYNSLIKDQSKTSMSIDLHNCPETSNNLANGGQSMVNAVRSQRTAAKIANEKIHSIYNS